MGECGSSSSCDPVAAQPPLLSALHLRSALLQTATSPLLSGPAYLAPLPADIPPFKLAGLEGDPPEDIRAGSIDAFRKLMLQAAARKGWRPGGWAHNGLNILYSTKEWYEEHFEAEALQIGGKVVIPVRGLNGSGRMLKYKVGGLGGRCCACLCCILFLRASGDCSHQETCCCFCCRKTCCCSNCCVLQA
jgi:hypothetical protein